MGNSKFLSIPVDLKNKQKMVAATVIYINSIEQTGWVQYVYIILLVSMLLELD